MGKKDKDELDDSDSKMFFGEASRGIPHAEFDRDMVSWLTEEYGSAYGVQLWENSLLDLHDLDLVHNALHIYDFDNHLDVICDIMYEKSPRTASSVQSLPRFRTRKYQLEWRERQYEKLFCKIQKKCKGEAMRQSEALGIERVREIRSHFKLRFGGVQNAMVKAREIAFTAGMKNASDKFAFMPYCNMEVKLNQLETERTFFWKTCPAECRDTYEFGMESKLTLVVLEHVPIAYDSAVKDVKNAVKLGK